MEKLVPPKIRKNMEEKLNRNKRGSTTGNEDVNLDTICGNLRGPTPNAEDDNETEDLLYNDTHSPRSYKAPTKMQRDSQCFIVDKTANERRQICSMSSCNCFWMDSCKQSMP